MTWDHQIRLWHFSLNVKCEFSLSGREGEDDNFVFSGEKSRSDETIRSWCVYVCFSVCFVYKKMQTQQSSHQWSVRSGLWLRFHWSGGINKKERKKERKKQEFTKKQPNIRWLAENSGLAQAKQMKQVLK